MRYLLPLLALAFTNATAVAQQWPAFRGPEGDGIALEHNLPGEWSDGQNVLWAVDLPMPGNSSPVVWDNRLFITGATDNGTKRWTLCFSTTDGALLWKDALAYDKPEPTHDTNPYCAATPITDGRRLIVSHGSAGVIAYDLEGKQLWHTELGEVHHIWGNASSPVLFEDTVIVYVGPGPQCALVALDKESGRLVWRKELQEAAVEKPDIWRGSWATPVLREASDGRTELILPLPGYIVSFNPQTGQEYWRCGGLGDLVYSSAMVGRDIIVAASGYMGPAIGFRRPGPEARGDITETHRLWRIEKSPQRIGTGVIIGPHLYMVNEPGVAECLEAATGQTLWKERLGAVTWGSPIYIDAKFYCTDSQGVTHVFAAAPTFQKLATNTLGTPQTTRATPAFSNGRIFIRTYDKLYCIGHK